ncbi:hypothetical protein CTAYLR_002100 [Chrysophaeum taylorii]|uniref:Protein Mpv17 n=1 Tax=Chrysophaeum taylorii TaxID=2483200 RepID=A0AAD7UME4_9STRA|nr:hypothetical protein CTAYLR_002100 [Chrysophaeum taylorii]
MQAAYARLATQNPYVVAGATAGGILCSADVAAQSLNDAWDPQRTLSLTVFGIVYYGGPCKFLYLAYDKYITNSVAKMVADVYVHSPLMLIPSFYAITGALKGETTAQIWIHLKTEWREAVLGTALYWTPIQLVCFRFVPQHSRIAFVSAVSFCHKVWLSYLSNRDS